MDQLRKDYENTKRRYYKQRYGIEQVASERAAVQGAKKRSTTKYEDPAIENSVNPLHEIERFLVKEPGKDQYPVKWKRYGNNYNTWYFLRALGDAQILVDEFESRRTTRRQFAATEDTNKKEKSKAEEEGQS